MDLDFVVYLKQFRETSQYYSDGFLHSFMNSIATTSCKEPESSECVNESEAVTLKMFAIVAILITSIAGIAIPLVGSGHRLLRPEGNLFFVVKAFAAGVILATGFVHILPDATAALTNPCLPDSPWSKFPFSGFVAMMASLCTLLADFLATQFYVRKQEKVKKLKGMMASGHGNGKVFGEGEGEGEGEGDGMHIVGVHAHVAQHSHDHSHSHGFGNSVEDEDNQGGSVRHAVVSQILELGVVSHSVIIGLSLGVSQSPCTIRPLLAALSFHQFFEGFALGGCICQAQFEKHSTIFMACFFAITTPLGIGIGTGISSLYDHNSPRALVVEGILDSISAGILVYMALVDLIASDFLSKRLSCNMRLQIYSYLALFLGAGLMSLVAIWA